MPHTPPQVTTAEAPETLTGLGPVPVATVRRQVTVPLRFADGYVATASVFTFDGLVDGREHLALGLGDWRSRVGQTVDSRVDQTVDGRVGQTVDGSLGQTVDGSLGQTVDGRVGPAVDGRVGPAADGVPAPLVRPHSECMTGDVFGSQRCDCGPQLREAVERISDHGGFLLYLRQEGRGIGLYAKLDAYALQDVGLDTYEANVALGHGEDERDYTVAAQMLHSLGADRIALLSNNPDKEEQLGRLGVKVTERVPTGVHLSAANARYLQTKANHTAHTIDLPLSD